MEKREYVIETRTYTMLVPPVRQSMPLCNRAASLIAPVLGTLNLDVNSGGRSAFSSAMSSVDPVQLDKLMMDAVLAGKLECDRTPVSTPNDFERHFSSYRSDVYPVCLWVLWECVKDFFPQLGAFAQTAKAAAEKFSGSLKDGGPIGGLGGQSGKDSVPGPNWKMAQ